MVRSVPFIIIAALFVCSPAFADQAGDAATPDNQLIHWAITLLGLVAAARLAWQAFGCTVVLLASLHSRGT
jgi:hypothetical protein